MSFRINKCFFTTGNLVYKQDVSLRMRTDTHHFGPISSFSFFEANYIKQLISNGSSKASQYHGVSRFIDDLRAINEGNEVLISFKNIYPNELELKVNTKDTKDIMSHF